jgi:acyl-CoA synthetase (AMP-forming)/AMP-acid ligase II
MSNVATVTSLARVLQGDPEHVVAARSGSHRLRLDFVRDVAGTVSTLDPSRRRWLLALNDAYEAAVALFAVWCSGGEALIPPLLDTPCIAEIAKDPDLGILHDSTVVPPQDRIAIQYDPSPSYRPFEDLDPECAISLFTSGSTGQRTLVRRTLRSLDAEVAAFEQLWGHMMGTRAIHGTVSHLHLYGLLFRVLWPLASARPFHAPIHFHLDHLSTLSGSPVLVSSPAHLTRLAKLDPPEEPPHLIFSSGAPLPQGTSDALAAQWGRRPIEVFGSSETGGVGWRVPEHSHRWSPLPGVEVSVSSRGTLMVASPFIAQVNGRRDDRYEMGDLGSLHPDGFELGHRADRIVKIEAQRISLEEVEHRVSLHALVEECRIITRRGGATRPLSTAALVVPSAHGIEFLQHRELPAYLDVLRSSLHGTVPEVGIPKQWLLVPSLPRDAQGKCTHELIESLFLSAEEERPILQEPRRHGSSFGATLFVPPSLPTLRGHFPGFPTVPGVMQIDWVMWCAERALGVRLSVHSLDNVKFHKLLRPGTETEIELTWTHGDEYVLSWRLGTPDSLFSSGRARCYEDPA